MMFCQLQPGFRL